MQIKPKETVIHTNKYEVVPGYEATQMIRNGVLSFVESAQGRTPIEAISNILMKLSWNTTN